MLTPTTLYCSKMDVNYAGGGWANNCYNNLLAQAEYVMQNFNITLMFSWPRLHNFSDTFVRFLISEKYLSILLHWHGAARMSCVLSTFITSRVTCQDHAQNHLIRKSKLSRFARMSRVLSTFITSRATCLDHSQNLLIKKSELWTHGSHPRGYIYLTPRWI